MNHSPLLGLDDEAEPVRPGHGMAALGPSDTSDSGSDVAGVDMDGSQQGLGLDTDAEGTGERFGTPGDPQVQEAGDILPDRIDVVPVLPVLGEEPNVGAQTDDPEGWEELRRQARRNLIEQPDDSDAETDEGAGTRPVA